MCVQLKGEHDTYKKKWMNRCIDNNTHDKEVRMEKSAMAHTHTHTTIENVCINIKWINNIICRKKIVNHKRTDLLNND